MAACANLAWAAYVPTTGTDVPNHSEISTNYTTTVSSSTQESVELRMQIMDSDVSYTGVISDGGTGKAKLDLTVSVNEDYTSSGELHISKAQKYSGTTSITTDETSIYLTDAGTLGTSNVTVSGNYDYLYFWGTGYGTGDNAFTGNINVTEGSGLTLVKDYDSEDEIEIKGTISGNASIELYEGTLKLSNSNTIQDGVALRSTLELAAKNAICDPNSYSGYSTGSDGSGIRMEDQAIIKITSGDQLLYGVRANEGTQIQTLKDATVTFLNTDTQTNLGNKAKITGDGNVKFDIIQSTSAIALYGANDYTGETTITGNGTVELNNGSALGTNTVKIDSNATLKFKQSSETTFNNKISGVKVSETETNYGTVKKTGSGILKIDASGTNQIEVKEFIQTAGELDIKGSLVGDLDLQGGTFSPGNSVGSIEITGATTVADAATIVLEVSGTSVDLNDAFTATGDLTLSENAQIVLTKTADSTLADGDSFEVKFTAKNSETLQKGDFMNHVSSSDFTNLQYENKGSYYAITGTYGSAPTTATPEPATWVLLALGMVGLMCGRRFQCRHNRYKL